MTDIFTNKNIYPHKGKIKGHYKDFYETVFTSPGTFSADTAALAIPSCGHLQFFHSVLLRYKIANHLAPTLSQQVYQLLKNNDHQYKTPTFFSCNLYL